MGSILDRVQSTDIFKVPDAYIKDFNAKNVLLLMTNGKALLPIIHLTLRLILKIWFCNRIFQRSRLRRMKGKPFAQQSLIECH